MATCRCGGALGYRPLPPNPAMWEKGEDASWALRHANAHATVYDDCGQGGCEVAGVHQPISFSYRMPPCSDDRGEPREMDECEDVGGYSHACRARLEPFSSWPASKRRPAAVSSPESVLDSGRIGHSCTHAAGAGSLRCDCVRYASP